MSAQKVDLVAHHLIQDAMVEVEVIGLIVQDLSARGKVADPGL